ncbi:MAG: site-2 protease family protein [Chloroflexota bacterium]
MLLILPVIYILFHSANGPSWLRASLIMLGILVSVLLHELGHTFVAQFFKNSVESIILWPLGGITTLCRRSGKIGQEIMIHVAGPLTNLLIAVALSLIVAVLRGLQVGQAFRDLAVVMVWMNLSLALSNLLPVCPLDGGSILYGLVQLRFGEPAANQVGYIASLLVWLGVAFLGVALDAPITFVMGLLLFLRLVYIHPGVQRRINMVRLYFRKAHVYHYLRHDYDRAILACAPALAANPNDIETLLIRGVSYFSISEWEPAQANFDVVLAREPDNEQALVFLGFIYMLMGEYDPALKNFERIKALNPDAADTYLFCGDIYCAQGQYELALGELQRAAALGEDSFSFYLTRSEAHYYLKHDDLARQDQVEAFQRFGPGSLSTGELDLASYKGKLDWAEDLFSWAQEKYPHEWIAYQARADAYLVNDQPDKAIVDYTRAIELAPKEWVSHLRRGMAYQKAGQLDRAVEDFRCMKKLTRQPYVQRRASQLLQQVTGETPSPR